MDFENKKKGTYNHIMKKSLVIFYIITMMIAFTTIYGDIKLGYKYQLIIGLLWILIAFAKLCLNGFKFKGIYSKDYKMFIKLYMIPHIIIHLYTIFLMIFGKISWSYFTTNMTVYIPTLLAILAIYIFNTKAYQYTVIALFLSWSLSVGTSLVLKGFVIFPNAITQGYLGYGFNGLNKNYLELHDCVLGIGYVLIFYIYSKHKLTKNNLKFIFPVLLIMFLGVKRISLIGVLLAVIFFQIVKHQKDNNKYKISIVLGWCGLCFCVLFVYMMSEGNIFWEYINKYNINVMGRNFYYQKIMEYAEFHPLFLGIGRNVTTQILNTELSYLKVGGVHSDIIKMYVENGFVLFVFWLWYYLIYLTKTYKKRYGISEAILYFGITIYTFTLYLTDNTEMYFICQIFRVMISMTYTLNQKTTKINNRSDEDEKNYLYM